MDTSPTEPVNSLLLTDPFQVAGSPTPAQGQYPCALDSYHYAALVVQSIDEGLGPPVAARSAYDQRFLDTFFGIRHRHPELLSAALHAVVYSDDLLIPNIDIQPGALMFGQERVVRYTTGGGYHMESEEQLAFLQQLGPLVLKHPISRHIGLEPRSYTDAIRRFLGFERYPDLVRDRETASRVVAVSVVIQELRSVLWTSREHGIPAITFAFDQWPNSPPPTTTDDPTVVLKLYFESAVHTPKVRTIREALELRQNSRIEQWRQVMREWTGQLTAGKITQAEVGKALREANGYVDGAKFLKDVVPSWSVFVTLPISLAKLFLDVPDVVAAVPLVLSTVKAYGSLVWGAVASKSPTAHGWYLLSEGRA